MRVLVTGGAGFIGSSLVDRLLAEGCDVDAIDDLSTGSLSNLADARTHRDRRFSFHRLDVCAPQLHDLVARRRPEVIFHLAAQLDVRVSVARPMFDAQVNILGSLNLCEAALGAGTRKVVFAGSGGTLYGVPETVPMREGHPQRPISPYGVAARRPESTPDVREALLSAPPPMQLRRTAGGDPASRHRWVACTTTTISSRPRSSKTSRSGFAGSGSFRSLHRTRPGRSARRKEETVFETFGIDYRSRRNSSIAVANTGFRSSCSTPPRATSSGLNSSLSIARRRRRYYRDSRSGSSARLSIVSSAPTSRVTTPTRIPPPTSSI